MNPWRARLQRWFTPVATRSPLTATQITLFALAINLVAAFALALARLDVRFFLAVPVLLTVGGLLDAIDGLVARIRGTTSLAGDFLDHFCDRVSDLSMMAGWCLGTGIRAEIALPSLVAIMLNGYAGTQAEATFGVRSYEGMGRGEYVIAMVALPIIAWALAVQDLLFRRFNGFSIPEWVTAALAVFAAIGTLQRVMKAVRTRER